MAKDKSDNVSSPPASDFGVAVGAIFGAAPDLTVSPLVAAAAASTGKTARTRRGHGTTMESSSVAALLPSKMAKSTNNKSAAGKSSIEATSAGSSSPTSTAGSGNTEDGARTRKMRKAGSIKARKKPLAASKALESLAAAASTTTGGIQTFRKSTTRQERGNNKNGESPAIGGTHFAMESPASQTKARGKSLPSSTAAAASMKTTSTPKKRRKPRSSETLRELKRRKTLPEPLVEAYAALEKAQCTTALHTENLEMAQHALKEAQEAVQKAQSSVDKAKAQEHVLVETHLDLLLNQDAQCPWNQMYQQYKAYKQAHNGLEPDKPPFQEKKQVPTAVDPFLGAPAQVDVVEIGGAAHAAAAAVVAVEHTEEQGNSSPDQHYNMAGAAAMVQQGDYDGNEDHVNLAALVDWVDRQRILHKEGKLEQYRVVALNKVGFTWSQKAAVMDRNLAHLVAYREKHGHFNIPTIFKENQTLANWVRKLRLQYKGQGKAGQKPIPPDLLDKLNAMDFTWDIYEDNFNTMFAELMEYKKKYGHVHVSPDDTENPRLVKFVKEMRAAYLRFQKPKKKLSREILTAERIELLEAEGFQWNKDGVKWYKKYLQLVRYWKKFGTCAVPKDYDVELYNFVNIQRRDYRIRVDPDNHLKGLSDRRIKLLKELGFVFVVENGRGRPVKKKVDPNMHMNTMLSTSL